MSCKEKMEVKQSTSMEVKKSTSNKENDQGIKENRMGTMPINRLLISISLPMMISMWIQSMYNIVDSIFVSRIGEDALAAVTMAFPLQFLMISTSSGIGVGINALLSRSLGERNFKAVNRAANNGIFVIFINYIIFALVGIFVTRFYFASQTDNPIIIEYGSSYLTICLTCSFGILFQMTMERLLQSCGKTIYTMITQGTGAILNIILDPILIFGYFGIPKMGVAGAAVATIIGQSVAMLMAIYFNIKKNKEITLSIKGFKPHGKTIRTIYFVGIPSAVMQAIGSIMTYGMNLILVSFSSTAVVVFGVYFKLNSFIFMPVFGLNNGLIPIISYNYGAKNKKRIMEAFFLGIKIAVGIMFIGLLAFQCFPEQLLGIFNASPSMVEIGVPALRTISLSFIFAGFCIVGMSMLQSFQEGFISLGISILRQLVIILPIAYLLSRFFGVNGVWWAFPIAEIAAVASSLFFIRRLYKRRISVLEQ